MDQRFSGAGSQVASQLEQLESRIANSLRAMTSLAEKMSSDTGTNMKSAMVSVFSELQNMNEEFNQRATTTTRDLNGFHNELSQTIESLAQVARRATDRTVERIMTLNSSIGQRIMDLRDTSSKAQEEGKHLEKTLAQHVGLVREANEQMAQNAERIETRGNAVLRNLMDASGTAMAQAELLSHIITREADSLRHAAKAAADQLDDSGATLEMARSEMYATLSASATQINDVIRDIEYQRGLLDGSHHENAQTQAALYEEILRLRDLTIELNRNISGTILASDDRAKELQQLTTRLGEVTMGVSAALEGGKNELAHVVGAMSAATQMANENLQQHTGLLSKATTKIIIDNDRMVEVIDTQRNAINQAASEGTRVLSGLTDQLQQTATEITSTSELAARDIEWLCNRVKDAGDAVAAMSGNAEEAIGRARSSLVLSEASLQRSASSARLNLSELAQRYNAEVGRVDDASEVVGKSYGSAITRLEELAHGLANQTFNTFDAMTEMGSLLDKRITQIRSGTTVANDQLGQTATLMQQNFETLIQLTQTATEQLKDVNADMDKTQTGMGVTSEHARSRVEAVRKELGIFTQDLMMMVSQATGQIESAVDGFNKRAEAMRDVANENATQIGGLGQQVRSEINQMADAVKQSTEQQGRNLGVAAQQLRAQAEQLMQAAVQSMQGLEQHGTRAMQRVTDLHESIDKTGQKLDQNLGLIQAKGASVQQATQVLGQQVEKSSAIIDHQSQAIQATAGRVAAAMAEAGKRLGAQIESFDTQGAAMQARVESLSNKVGQQAAILQAANDQAEKTAEKLSQSEIRLRRDAFMNAAKYLVESLNSLAIDLTRVLDPVEADRVWKEFNKGDSSAFTRRFLQMRDETSAKRLREKFETDYEFRTYVQRYFRQFEELYEQAQRNDHHDMLATTITTSDVGKLYTYLAGAFGHARLRAASAA